MVSCVVIEILVWLILSTFLLMESIELSALVSNGCYAMVSSGDSVLLIYWLCVDFPECEKQCQEFEGHLEAKDGSIKDLERRLAEMQGRFQHALCDVNIQRQQDHYISCMNERKPSKMYSCRKSLRKV